jgi:hypothetical protein
MNARRSPAAVAAALLLGACATAPDAYTTDQSAGEVVPAPSMADAAAPVVIRVTSQYAGPVAIYSVSEGVATRLGDVGGGRVEQFRLAAMQVPTNGLTLMAVPRTGDARGTTGRLLVAPGSVVEFTIGPALTDARAAIR